MIPKLIHVIWLQGYSKMPKKLKENLKNLRKLNPEFEFIFWDNDSIQSLINTVDIDLNFVYNNVDKLSGGLSNFTCQSDIGRFVILYKYGGIYTDIDITCTISFNSIIKNYPKCDLLLGDSTYKILKHVPLLSYKPKYFAGFIIIKKQHFMWKPIFDIIKKAKSRNTIDQSVDRYIQQNDTPVCTIDSEYLSSHTSCKIGKCYFPRESSWFNGRKLIIDLSCKMLK